VTDAASPRRLSPTALHTIARAKLHRALNAPMQRGPRGAFRPGHTIGRKRPLPRQQHPIAIEADFAAAILSHVLAPVRAALAPLLAALPGMLAANARADADSDGDEPTSPLPIMFVAGIPIAIENPAGSVRRWTDSDGTTGETTMRFAYGFIAGTTGADGEDIDAYVGPVADPHWIYIVHQQRKADGFASYDEDKVMLGFASPDAAEAAYRAQYDDPRFFGGMTTMSVEAFRVKLAATDGGMIAHCDRMDGGDVARARGLIDKARASLDRNALNPHNLKALADRYASATTVFQKAQLARQVKAALGVDLVLSDPKVPGLVEKFVHEGVARIESLGNRSLDDVSRVVAHAFTTGDRAEDVSADIAKRYDISERHARFIARDQIGTLTGQVNAARQVEIGIARFRWRSMEDERVRPEHAVLDGQEFSYDDPPSEGLPGTPYICRCGAEPVFDGIVAAVNDESAAA
jgi:SPP1 gp7 family putative phage head morphogenesis protein